MNTDLHITPIAAFSDNYIWVIHNQRYAVAVDPGDANAVTAFLRQHDLSLAAILITHHHHDHTGGNEALVLAFNVPVYGPSRESIPCLTHPLSESSTIRLEELDLELRILDVPGHTAGHIAYYADGMLFCGDTLFGCGCGRLFEGTPEQMLASLSKLGQLPENTSVYCAHEYTLSNIEFALTLEPDNQALQARAATDLNSILEGRPTLPSTIARERATNPFLRCHLPSARVAAQQATGKSITGIVEIFSALRTLKNDFRTS
ncbi:hydroxyacylglutathione hydrolase [Sulfuriferula sp. AH1]|uniref:hydroxyacylglutathione hydrolase n=1 Tax=Sulfuriferula sp. AH1 TaxID=1985873 RepID=UPI000B3B0EB4|nr:hydroxyacylglutathione hydrolase [Sulfuriferula sp. AH1]ARU31640.1 hydroxyacylglutathione hydrolase [Sulfuriferula sp. AH1]